MNLDEKDGKAELAVIGVLHGKSRGEQRSVCDEIGLPWDEYLRLLRKWSRVIERMEAK